MSPCGKGEKPIVALANLLAVRATIKITCEKVVYGMTANKPPSVKPVAIAGKMPRISVAANAA